MTRGMKWLGFLATLLIVVMLGINIARESSRQQAARQRHLAAAIEQGTDLYALHCASCHGAAGEGLAAYPALDQAFMREQDAQTIYAIIERGRYNTEMAAYGINESGALTVAQLDSLVTVIKAGPWEAVERRVAELGLTPPEETIAAAPANAAALLPTNLNPDQAMTLAQELFLNNCVECHGENGAGTAQAPQLNNAYVRGMSEAQLVNIITKGVLRTEMDSFRDTFSPDEIAVLVYMLQNWEDAAPNTPTPTVDTSSVTETGQELFETWCAICHGVQGEGGSIAPSLNDIPPLPADFITSRVRGGYNAMPPFSESDVSNAQLAVLIDYAQTRIFGSRLPILSEEEMKIAAGLYVVHCAECHGEVGQGTAEKGPALVVSPPLRASEITNFVRFGSAQAEAISPDTLPDQELEFIIAYIHSLSGH